MLKRPQFTTVLIRPNNLGHYLQFGYECKLNEMIKIDTEHLSNSSKNEVLVECDYCGIEYSTKFCYYHKSITLGLESGILKSCCDTCTKQHKKLKEVLVNKHGFKPLPTVKFKQFEKDLMNSMRKTAISKIKFHNNNSESNASYLEVAERVLNFYNGEKSG
ncbi:hypothetical protein CON65_20405 [Bacillus pseudomycoides]|uniref:Uncharacterized protein n=1 Tax=Bacillus pseudomycoides TaxID=64104 RepID=A0AA91ZRX5_9BACI|nr:MULTISPECIES: hypothetical protein [Bacillus]PEB50409.1 hypothetical protein COO03_22350 [Bacillus sp. AFS098217]PED80859.1 hypothetical protein CON65_20405 [Bacillus pseudomycoides]PEU11305.1 hypothetical protein CN525_22475 [Bacillus sp. AFS014408]PFW57974.1 hypothetical protein COL20_25750 [Bacillus sp. AFS075034]